MEEFGRPSSPRSRFIAWVGSHRLFLIIATSLLLIGATGVWAWYALSEPLPVMEHVPSRPKPKPKFYSPLTGIEVKDEAATKQAVTAIMIENSPDARPQSGLKAAGVVYEAIAEGGVTRFLTLHQEGKPQMIGPVRSIRMYYVDWLTPYNASIAHVGGSPEALSEVRNGAYRDIDEFFNSTFYWRATDRAAPHNVYTSFKKLDALNRIKGYKTSSFTGFERTDEKKPEKPTATKISIRFGGYLYNTAYSYDAATNSYKRSLADTPHLDREGGRITPKVVIAMRVNQSLSGDGYHQRITTTGQGQAIIFQNGEAIKATWRKESRKSQLQFVDADGKAIPLVRGQTWIGAVPNSGGAVSWR